MEHLLKTSAIIAIFYVFYKLFLQRETFFEQNRWFLIMGLFTSFLLPFLVIPIYIETTPLNLSNFNFENAVTAQTIEKPINILEYLPIIYGLGVAVFSIRFLVQFLSLALVIFKNKGENIGGFTHIKTTTNISPFSFFNWIVYNPKQFSETELNQILTHEKIHATQKHTFDILLTHISCILLWFNPFIWLYNKDLKQNLEFIADKETANLTICKKSYQYTLLKTSMPSHQMALSNPFYNSLIKKRIVMLHKSKSKKINQLKYALVIPALGFFLMSFNTKEVYVSKNPVYEPISKNDIINAIITKDFSEVDFNDLKSTLKTEGYTATFKNIKRNANKEITSIDIEIKSKNSNTNFEINTDEAINPIKITIEDGKISISNSGAIKEKQMVFTSRDSTMINKNITENNVFIFKSDDDDENHSLKEKIIIMKGDTLHVLKNTDGKTMTVAIDDNGKKTQKIIKIRTNENDNNISWTSDEDEKIIISSKSDRKIKIVSTNENNPLFILDGEEISKDIMNSINPNSIQSIEILKDDASTKVYDKKGKGGVVLITSKNESKKKPKIQLTENTLYKIDGKEVKKEDVDELNPEDIYSVDVLKGETAIKKYGDKGKNGVVEITTKKKK